MTSLSVIIPAYEHLTDVLQCLTSLQAFASKQIPIEFIVADDASPTTFFPALLPPCSAKVVRSEVNGGFAANCNTGASFAEGDILLFCNQDVFAVGEDTERRPFSAGWDIPLVQAFENTEVGIVGAKLLFPDGKIQSAGGKFDGRTQPTHRCLGYGDHRYWEVNTPEEVSWVTGAFLAIRTPLFKQLEGFSLEYSPSYFEDVDLCLRAKEAGFTIWYEPRCQLVHRVGTTGGSPYFARSAQTFYKNWVETEKVKPDMYTIRERFW